MPSPEFFEDPDRIQELYSGISVHFYNPYTGKSQTFRYWVKAEIVRTLDKLCGTAELEIEDVAGNNYGGLIESKATIWLHMRDRKDPDYKEDRKVMTGYVRSMNEVRGQEKTTIQMGITDITIDLMECNPLINDPENPPVTIPFTPYAGMEGAYESITLADMVGKFCEPFGIKVEDYSKDTEVFSKVVVEETTTVWEQIRRLCNQRGVLAYTDQHGTLCLGNLRYTTDGFDNTTFGSKILRHGRAETWKKGTAYTFSKSIQYKYRYSHYRTKIPQTADGSWGDQDRTLINNASSRYRPKVVRIRDEQKKGLNNFALWQSQNDYGHSIQCEGHFSSWNRWNKFAEGKLLDPYIHFPGQRVNLNMPEWGHTTKDWIKTEVRYYLSGQQSRHSKVTLRPAQMYAKLKENDGDNITRDDLSEGSKDLYFGVPPYDIGFVE